MADEEINVEIPTPTGNSIEGLADIDYDKILPDNWEDLSDDEKHKWYELEIDRVVRAQQTRIDHLAKFGMIAENLAGRRHEAFIGYLVSLGVLTQLQLDQFNHRETVDLLLQLDAVVKEADAQHARAKLMHGVRKPTPRDIVLPPGARR